MGAEEVRSPRLRVLSFKNLVKQLDGGKEGRKERKEGRREGRERKGEHEALAGLRERPCDEYMQAAGKMEEMKY